MMKLRKYRPLLLTLVLPLLLAATGEEKKDKKKDWDIAEAHGPTKSVEFDTDEGTWMSLDVSPDGKDIVFDLLGDIYIMPFSGGEAKLLSGGMPWEVQPRFSPDGSKISFTSDREGADNIWIMNRDGSKPHSVTKETFRLLNNAVWAPDGNYIIAKKHFTAGRSLGSGEMWMYHTGGGSGLQLTTRKNDQQDVGEPCLSPDGRYLFWSEDMTPGPSFQYNKDPNAGIYVIRRLDRETGKIQEIVGGPGGAVRPQVSPDGKTLAFVRRVRTKSVLYLYSFETAEEWPIYDKLNKDQQETWATFGVYPNYNFTPDGKNIVVWASGKIWKVPTSGGEAINIPFKAHIKQTITDALHFPQQVAPETFEAKMIRDATTSPDGKMLAFNAAGHIYIKSLPNGKAERLTAEEQFEFDPAWGPDNKSLVYISWDDSNKSAICKYNFTTKKSIKLTTQKGYYYEPSFSWDGNKILYRRGEGDDILGNSYNLNQGIYWMSANGGSATLITEEGSEPRFNTDGSRIFFNSSEGKNKAYKSISIEGKFPRTHFSSQYGKNFTPSPDGKWIAFTDLFQAYVAPLTNTGNPVDLSAGNTSYPIYKVSKDVGDYLHWSGDSKTLHWMMGPEYFSRKISDCFTWAQGAKDSLPPKDTVGIKLGLVLKTDIPTGKIALRGARIISMKGQEVIENGTIVIEKNKIIAIGKSTNVTIPKDAKVVDVNGKTIMPGMVDVHAHNGNSGTGISPQQQYSYYAQLAYGVTTTHDPSSNTEMVFSQSEMQKAGLMIGPRIYSTGSILYGADGDFKVVINSLDDARSHLRRLKAVGAFSVKSYNQPRRNQRQMVIQAARELQMEVVPEGGSFFNHNMTQVMDGHTGIEHCIPIAPVYKDVLQFWSASKTAYTPTLIVAYGGMMGENYWYQKTNVWENTRLLTYYPRALIDGRSRRRSMLPDDEWGYIENSKVCKAMMDKGVKVNLGAHGQLNGLGSHWELWMLQQGGMTNWEALHCATLSGAEYIGMEKEIGSLETGKLADLVIMDKNPLDNIQNSNTISYVMLNGRLYDASNMNETGNYNKPRHKFWWEYNRAGTKFEWHSCTEEGE